MLIGTRLGECRGDCVTLRTLVVVEAGRTTVDRGGVRRPGAKERGVPRVKPPKSSAVVTPPLAASVTAPFDDATLKEIERTAIEVHWFAEQIVKPVRAAVLEGTELSAVELFALHKLQEAHRALSGASAAPYGLHYILAGLDVALETFRADAACAEMLEASWWAPETRVGGTRPGRAAKEERFAECDALALAACRRVIALHFPECIAIDRELRLRYSRRPNPTADALAHALRAMVRKAPRGTRGSDVSERVEWIRRALDALGYKDAPRGRHFANMVTEMTNKTPNPERL